MKRVFVLLSALLIFSLVHKNSVAIAAVPQLYVKEWEYLVTQTVIQEDELETNWKDAITRMEAVVYLARALKLEPPVATIKSTDQTENLSVEEDDQINEDEISSDDTNEEQGSTEFSEQEEQTNRETTDPMTDEETVTIEVEIEENQTQEELTTEESVEEEVVASEESQIEIQATEPSLFTDVPVTHENYWMLAEFHKRGILKGFPDGSFRPDQALNRADMALVITATFGLKGSTTSMFKDVPKSMYFHNAVQSLLANSITAGYPDYTYRPQVATTHEHVLLFIARSMNPSFRVKITLPPPPPPAPKACEVKVSKPVTKIAVQAANFWKKPGMSRPIDAPATVNPTDLRRWSKSLTESQSWWLVQQTDTQALYGDKVSTIQTSGSWVKVATKDQWVPYNAGGYPGWVPSSQLTKSYYDYTNCRIAIVHAKTTWLKDNSTNKNTVEISYSTILPVVGEGKDYWIVAAPNDKKMRVAKTDVKVHKNYAAVPKPSATTVINEAKRFLGLRYIWSGTSAYGFDCSGILYAIMRTHGVLIPRDSFYQATKGTWVSKANLRAGDFVFFAGNNGTGKVYHVGLYLGNGMMLHAPNASSVVKTERYDNGAYKRNYYTTRRYVY